MIASRGMGIISPDKIPSANKKRRREEMACGEYADGGKVRKQRRKGFKK